METIIKDNLKTTYMRHIRSVLCVINAVIVLLYPRQLDRC